MDKLVCVIPHVVVGLILQGEVEKGRRHIKDLVKSCVYTTKPYKTQRNFSTNVAFVFK